MGYCAQSSRSMQGSKVHTSVQAVHCTTPGGTTPGGTFPHEYGNPASIEPEVRQDMEQMVSDDEEGRLMKGVQEKQKQCWCCCR